MKRLRIVFSIAFLSMLNTIVYAQVSEQQMEQQVQQDEEKETDDDAIVQQLMHYLQHPLNINTATAEELAGLQLLSPLDIEHLIAYRNLLGLLVDVHELQAVPGWTAELFYKMRPYITVSVVVSPLTQVAQRFRKSSVRLLLRASQVLEKSKGYTLDPDSVSNYYRGSPQKILFRFTGSYRQQLRYGVLGEKDAGEQWFRGKQKLGFDFYSAHIFLSDVGSFKAIAIGDFTTSLGQGLIAWQGMAFKKGAEVMNSKREGMVLRPYHAAGENAFHRGLGFTVAVRKAELTIFASYRRVDANLEQDTLIGEAYVTSLPASGNHRTAAEIMDKGIQRQLVWGGRISYRHSRFKIGLNAIVWNFGLPLNKGDEPYNRFAFRGKRLGNYSLDYSFSKRGIHFFGEVALSGTKAKAIVSGLVMSLSPSADLSLLARHLDRDFHSFQANAFTENSQPTNETGLYMGLCVRPARGWKINAYADMSGSPWLRYRINKPATGLETWLQISYKPNKITDLSTYYRFTGKGGNSSPETSVPVLYAVNEQQRHNWRIHLITNISREIILRWRIDMNWVGNKGSGISEGVGYYADILYKPPLKPWSSGFRLMYFDTRNYDTRIYAYENDVLYAVSVPVFYGKGYRYYVNFDFDINKKCTAWLRWSQTIYSDKTLIGSGLDEISGNRRSEVKIQILYKF